MTIGNSVTTISDYAFYGCSSLTSVTIGSSVKSIDDYAFIYCYKLVEVCNLSSLNIVAGSKDNGYVGYYAKNVYTPNSGESKLTTTDDGFVFISDESGKYYLVEYNGTATELVLPDDFNGNSYAINDYAFFYCSSLTSVTIPNSVTTIGESAFFYCSSLTSVTIPDSVTTIGESAFQGCSGLTSITIGSGVTSIGEGAFNGCSKLSEVYYGGSASDWAKISIGSSNYSLTNASRYYYSEVQPTTAGNYWHYGADGVTVVKW